MAQVIYGDRIIVGCSEKWATKNIFAENIESVRQAFSRSPMSSIRTAVRELELPLTTVHKVLFKRLRLYAYRANVTETLAK